MTYRRGAVFGQTEAKKASLCNGKVVVRVLRRLGRREGELEGHGEISRRRGQAQAAGAEVDELREVLGTHEMKRLPKLQDVPGEEGKITNRICQIIQIYNMIDFSCGESSE